MRTPLAIEPRVRYEDHMDIPELPVDERVRVLSRKYSSEALVYEHTWAAGLREMGRRLLEHFDLTDARCVIDVGAGVGALLPDIAELAPDAFVVGVDRSEGMIARAPAEYGRAVMDATELGLPEQSVDAAVMAFVLFHLPDPLDGLAEARRVLRPGGWIGTTTWGPDESWPALETWGEELDAHGADSPGSLLSDHSFGDAPEKIAALLDKAGFEDVRSWSDTLQRQFDLDTFVEFVSGMAIAKRRLDSLGAEEQKSFLTAARETLEKLEPADFRLTSEVILGTGVSP